MNWIYIVYVISVAVTITSIILLIRTVGRMEKNYATQMLVIKTELDHATRLALALCVMLNVNPQILKREMTDLPGLTKFIERLKHETPQTTV